MRRYKVVFRRLKQSLPIWMITVNHVMSNDYVAIYYVDRASSSPSAIHKCMCILKNYLLQRQVQINREGESERNMYNVQWSIPQIYTEAGGG